MISAGIDCGAKSTKTIIMRDGEIIGRGSVATGFDQEKAVEDSLEMAIQSADIARDDIERIGGTGSGKNAIDVADISVNDIKAMGRGAHHFFPNG
ncbi:MAG: CoA activase, partial [Deltaproteobacteria bacterium]|nr:CoA activase [Deltaproteobacteria bacterium]